MIVESNNVYYDSRNNCNAIIETATNTLIAGCKNTIIPNSVTSIGDYAFSHCSGLTSISIPNSVTSIGGAAFSGCSGLTSISIPNSVTSIGDYVFYYCEGLTSVTIGSGVTSIGSSAFRDCSRLTKVYCNAEKVPTTSADAFQNANISKATLIVPGSSVSAYTATSPWSGFRTIKDNGIYSGSCGDNVNYSLDTSTGLLSITGTGAMNNYDSYSSVPWYSNRSYIKTVEISDGVTSIGFKRVRIIAWSYLRHHPQQRDEHWKLCVFRLPGSYYCNHP